MKTIKQIEDELNKIEFIYEKEKYLLSIGFSIVYTSNLPNPLNLWDFQIEKLKSRLHGNSRLKDYEGKTILYIQTRNKVTEWGQPEYYFIEVPHNYSIINQRIEKLQKINENKNN
jgi:hypothetical protein